MNLYGVRTNQDAISARLDGANGRTDLLTNCGTMNQYVVLLETGSQYHV